MMRFAFGAKWGRPGSPPSLGRAAPAIPAAAKSFGFNNAPRANAPTPPAVRPKNSRRVRWAARACRGFMAWGGRGLGSFVGQRFIEIEQQARDGRVCGEFDRVEAGRRWRFADREQRLRLGRRR